MRLCRSAAPLVLLALTGVLAAAAVSPAVAEVSPSAAAVGSVLAPAAEPAAGVHRVLFAYATTAMNSVEVQVNSAVSECIALPPGATQVVLTSMPVGQLFQARGFAGRACDTPFEFPLQHGVMPGGDGGFWIDLKAAA